MCCLATDQYIKSITRNLFTKPAQVKGPVHVYLKSAVYYRDCPSSGRTSFSFLPLGIFSPLKLAFNIDHVHKARGKGKKRKEMKIKEKFLVCLESLERYIFCVDLIGMATYTNCV